MFGKASRCPMNQEHNAISVGYKLGQGVSSLNRMYISLKLYMVDKEDEVLLRVINEMEDLIKKLTL